MSTRAQDKALEDMVEDLGIKATIDLLAAICRGQADNDESDEDADTWDDVAEQLDEIETGEL